VEKQIEKNFERDIKVNELLIYKVCGIYAFNTTDRKDLFQEIIIQLWKAYPKFKGEASFSTWLYRVAINTAITGVRRKNNLVSSVEPSSMPVDIHDDEHWKEKEERLQQMYRAIEKLNKIEKAIVMLYMEERPYEEMEQILGISQGTLRVKMTRIKEKLRELTKNN
jgi:RNA polymerase sigma factor (sigma-70 family)